MPIRIRLFLIFLLFSVIFIVAVATAVNWSFQSGYDALRRSQEREFLEQVQTAMESVYVSEGSWDQLKVNPQLLNYWLRTFNLDSLAPPPPPPPAHDPGMSLIDARVLQDRAAQAEAPVQDLQASEVLQPSLMPPKHKSPHFHFFQDIYLLDSQQQWLAGASRDGRHEYVEPLPIMAAGITVGYVGLARRFPNGSPLEGAFRHQQGRNLIIIVTLASVFSLLFAWLVAQFVMRRLHIITGAIRKLGKGDYSSTLPVTGRDELNQVAQQLNSLTRALNASEQSRRRWVADVSHELRTPLSTLRAQLEALEDGIHEYGPEVHQRLYSQVLRLHQLIEDLYQLSLSDIGAMQYRKEACNLATLVEDAAAAHEPQFLQAGLAFSCHTPRKQAAMILGDAQRLNQLLANLMQNSLRYTEAPGSVKLELRKVDSDWCLSLCDSAPGVAPNLYERLFDRLFRAETSRNRETGGAGLGLNLCKNIAIAHDAQITAEPSPLGGVCIKLRFKEYAQ